MDTGRRIRNREVEIVPAADAGGQAVEPVPVAISTTMLADVGAGPSHVILLQDLRAVRQLENLRLRTGKLEAVSELSASLAHELKNPLASIRSAVEQLARRTHGNEDERTLARLILRESDRLSRILAEFSDFARVDVAARKPVDVGRLIGDVIETVRRHPAAEGRATITREIVDDMSGLWGDPELLHRTLLNLVLNAVQVGDADSPVRVRVIADALRPDLVPSEVALGHPVRVRVIDDGPGIAPEDLPRIFDPFYTRRKGGSGLGLSIAHRAVQAHGGALIATSDPGKGATFAMVLPRRTGRGRASTEMRRPGPEDSGTRRAETAGTPVDAPSGRGAHT
jgi:signal transduction histidine kinase